MSGTTTFDFSKRIVTYTVPATGLYEIDAIGADGGVSFSDAGGLGAEVSGDFQLTEGEVLSILVGGSGSGAPLFAQSGGGGGGRYTGGTGGDGGNGGRNAGQPNGEGFTGGLGGTSFDSGTNQQFSLGEGPRVNRGNGKVSIIQRSLGEEPTPAPTPTTTFGTTRRIVTYTVPVTGLYETTAIGASGAQGIGTGGKGGLGAEVSGDVKLIAGEVLSIAVGGAGFDGEHGGPSRLGSRPRSPAQVLV
jgi:hypothetical protein